MDQQPPLFAMSSNQSNFVEKHLYFTLSYNESLIHHFQLLIYHFQQLVLQSSVENAVTSLGIKEENHRLQTGFFENKTKLFLTIFAFQSSFQDTFSQYVGMCHIPSSNKHSPESCDTGQITLGRLEENSKFANSRQVK